MAADLNPDLPMLDLVPEAFYRRRIRLTADERRRSVVGELEDDFHHFVARVEHDGVRVTHVVGESPRHPWTTCPGSFEPLRQLCGVLLQRDMHVLARHVDVAVQCTHLLDVALLAVAHAAAGRGTRVYDAEVPGPGGSLREGTLRRDGSVLLHWSIDHYSVQTPGPMQGRLLLGSDYARAIDAIDDPDEREATMVLRRACLISSARIYDIDRVTDVQAFGRALNARCHTFSPEVVHQARRIVGASRDFTNDPAGLLNRASEPAQTTPAP